MQRIFTGLLVFLSSHALTAALQVQVSSSLAAPQPVGTEIVFNFSASDSNANPGVLNYKFEVEPPQATNFLTVRDFEAATSFAWARNLTEGNYQIRVTARDSNYLSSPSQVVLPFRITSRITSNQPVVNATTHPLVALFSAPACAAGSSMQVVFHPASSSVAPFNTNMVACNGKASMNFLIAGMLPSTAYSMYSQTGVSGGVLTNSSTVTFTTGAIPSTVSLVPVTPIVSFGSSSSQKERLSLLSFNTSGTIDAVSTIGRVIWYYAGNGAYQPNAPAVAQLDRLLAGGLLLTHCGYPGDYTGTGIYGNQQDAGQAIQIIDLTGHVVQETNVDRINEQLVAMGTDPVSEFTHDIRLLPNGDIIAVGETQKIFPAGTQGNPNPIDVVGTTLVELNKNFQVDWYWDSFDHAGGNGQLDITRAAVLNEKCSLVTGGIDGCPPLLLTVPANDWLHTNTIQYMAQDGSLIISFRNQDWIAKLDYNNGAGTGNLLWIMGQDGTFAMNNLTGDPYPWFSHQHDVEFQNNGNQLLTMFDNGNTRITSNGGDSRGYVLNVNESGLQVTPQILTSLGYYAVAQGSAQILSNGDYEFMGGQIVGTAPHNASQTPSPTFYQQGAEITPAGVTTFSEAAQSAAYRLWRVPDFYHGPAN